jgi:hypothetical protein
MGAPAVHADSSVIELLNDDGLSRRGLALRGTLRPSSSGGDHPLEAQLRATASSNPDCLEEARVFGDLGYVAIPGRSGSETSRTLTVGQAD